MDTLPNDILDTIHKYKHQLEYIGVMDEMQGNFRLCLWCFNPHMTKERCGCPLDLDMLHFMMQNARDERQSRCSRSMMYLNDKMFEMNRWIDDV